jgi:hypothetical protein
MTLAQWAEGWPYRLTLHQTGMASVPDWAGDESYRAKAWGLTDYRVSSVSGGSIWFAPR